MAGPIHLRVLTDAGIALDEQAASIIAPGERGDVGFLARHAPLVTTVRPGKLAWRTVEGRVRVARVGAGLLEILRDRLTLLTDSVEMLEGSALHGARHSLASGEGAGSVGATSFLKARGR